MKSYTKTAIAALVFFILLNTIYFWEGQLAIWAIPVTLALIIYFVVLTGLFIRQLVAAFKEKFTNRGRLFCLLFLLLVLISGYLAPGGLIDFDRLSGKDVLVAEREGVANCRTTLKLKDNGTFIQREVCFGVIEIKGHYIIKNDTLFFINVRSNRQVEKFYEYAILKQSIKGDKKNVKADLFEYNNKADTMGYPLFVEENNLKGLPGH